MTNYKMNADFRQIGKELTKGAVAYLGALFILGLIIVAVVGAIFDWPRRDDTDSAAERSGMTLRVDWGTGCQYLETRGGVTPRLGRDGKQVCRP